MSDTLTSTDKSVTVTNPSTVIDVIVEVEQGSNLKYEIDHGTNQEPILRLDRILSSSMAYPGNYGYIPNTLAEDGDPLDALILTPYKLHPGCIVECKAIGVLIMSDEKGLDEKILAVPADTVDNSYQHINNLTDLPQPTLDKIQHFFAYYKMTDPNRWSKVEGFQDRTVATQLIKKYQT